MQHQIIGKKQIVDPVVFNSDTFVDSAVTVYPIYIDYEDECRQHTPSSQSNSHCERL